MPGHFEPAQPRKPPAAWSRLLGALHWWLLPGCCTACRLPSHRRVDLCRHCQDALPTGGRRCHGCALPLPAATGGWCADCQRTPPAWDHLVWVGPYQDPYPSWISALKFHRDTAQARLLGWLLAARVQALRSPAMGGNTLPQALVPVPLHPLRMLRRGYNQATLIACHSGRLLGCPVLARAARRRRYTAPQTRLGARLRARNLAPGTITARLPPGVKHVAVVDDVLTTGSTATAMVHALRLAGATRVDLWVVARADPPTPVPGKRQTS